MRAAILTALLCVGCGFVPKPSTEQPETQGPKATERVTMVQLREQVVGKLTRDQVKQRFGKPDKTVEVGNSVDWIWNHKDLAWNPDSEKFYRQVYVRFPLDGGETVTATKVDGF